jgi:hypothetical protein
LLNSAVGAIDVLSPEATVASLAPSLLEILAL